MPPPPAPVRQSPNRPPRPARRRSRERPQKSGRAAGAAIALGLAAVLGAAAGCGSLPAGRDLPTSVDHPAVVAAAPDGRTVTLGLALRQEIRPGDPHRRPVICHVDLAAGDRLIGFYNTFSRRRVRDRLTNAYAGAFREYDWLAENRPYYIDADAAKNARIRDRGRVIVTTWIGTRVTPAMAARLHAAMDARRGRAALYRLLESNCATRLAELLAEAGYFPGHRGFGAMPGVDRPAKLARLFADRAPNRRVWIARGWFGFGADGRVRVEALPPPPPAPDSACAPRPR